MLVPVGLGVCAAFGALLLGALGYHEAAAEPTTAARLFLVLAAILQGATAGAAVGALVILPTAALIAIGAAVVGRLRR